MAAIILLMAVALVASAQEGGSGYAGSKACYGCHTNIYQSFLKTDMGRSMSPAGDWNTDELPAQATVAQPGSPRTFTVSRNSTGWVQSESEADLFHVDYPLAYCVGSGMNGLTFLIRRGEYLFQAPISYYSRTRKWDLSPGYEHVELGFARVVPEECINCHTGRAQPVPNRPGAYREPAFLELAIGCENCHGPGEAHIKALGKVRGSIVNPAKLAPRLAENICLNCHQTGDSRVLQPGKSYSDFRPGQWLIDTAFIFKKPPAPGEGRERDLLEHNSALQASRCFRASNGKLSCLTCHDPHVQPRGREVAPYFRAKCLTCHTDESCKLPLTSRAEENPADNCVACHMPKRGIQQISHSALTNHRIPARPDEPIPAVLHTEANGLLVVNAPPGHEVKLSKITLLRAYGELAGQDADYQLRYAELLDELAKTDAQNPYVQQALGHKALNENRNEDAVSHLKLALPLDQAGVYLELGQALGKLGRTQESIEYLKKGVELAPFDSVMQKTLILEYVNTKAYNEATILIKQYVETFPEDTFMRDILARVTK